MKPGKFITIEGTEGAGKSTALQAIKTLLLQANKEVILTREPGGTEIAEAIRQVLLTPQTHEKMTAQTELLLMFAGRSQHLETLIRPALQKGQWVVSDRFIDASYAYQVGGRGIAFEEVAALDKMIVQHGYPDLTLLLDISAEHGLKRTEQRGGQKDRIEQEKIDFFIRVRNAYLDRAKAEPNRIKVIDASLSLPQVTAQIHAVLNTFLLTVDSAQ